MYDVIMHEVPLENCIEPTVGPEPVRRAGQPRPGRRRDRAGAGLQPGDSAANGRSTRCIDDYDYVLIDCPPSLGLLTVNGLAAATEVLVPIQCEYYALEGLGQLLRNVDLVKRNLNPQLEVSDDRAASCTTPAPSWPTRSCKRCARTSATRCAEPSCRGTVRLSEAPSFGQPIITFDPTFAGRHRLPRGRQRRSVVARRSGLGKGWAH